MLILRSHPSTVLGLGVWGMHRECKKRRLMLHDVRNGMEGGREGEDFSRAMRSLWRRDLAEVSLEVM